MKSKKLLWAVVLLPLFLIPILAADAIVIDPSAGGGLNPIDALSFVLNLLPPKIQAALFAYLAVVGGLRHAGKLWTTLYHAYCTVTKKQPNEEFLARVENSPSLRTALFWIDLLLSWKPYRGPATPAAAPSNPTSAVTPPQPTPTSFTKVATLFMVIGALFTMAGCAKLQHGADPVIVRAEQAERSAKSSFDFLLHIEDASRDFYKTNAPGFHKFCEFLREPQTIDGTNYSHAIALIKSVDAVKLAYKTGRASSNDVVKIVTTLEAAGDQSAFWLSTTKTNQLKK